MNAPGGATAALGQGLLKTAVREELEATRQAFHDLLAAVPESAWRRRGPGSAWTVKEELWHITWGAQFMLNLIRNARRGIGLPKPPMAIADRLNALYSRLRAVGVSPASIATRYDRTHTALLAELDSLGEDEWQRSVHVFGEPHTIEYLFHGIAHHLEEHAARIRPCLE